MKSAWLGLVLLLLPLHSVSARPPQSQESQQDDSTSIVDAARRAREQRKEQPKATRVWDNDTIPKKPGDVSVIGATPAAPAGDSAGGTEAAGNDAGAPAGDKGTGTAKESGTPGSEGAATESGASGAAAPGASSEGASGEKSDRDKLAAEVSQIQADLTAAKSRVQTLRADLDILQRKYNLDSQTYYSKPNYAADKDGAAAIEAEKAGVEAKQQEVADAQMKVDQLEAKLAAIR